ncbi:2-C-methyl-D-erythritol 2,4-cyclodiphosphate synthase [Candidatus Methylospira mobilis]|uniref:2-C-methyl-D-erythritol 2,4-cyclodiphosphate synthase n=1 Tax=Candidatus Methylospira mobilis TaxID=1808979 RepID=A0A5Q0BJI0_9GAMM|nr:2-C-methyl-D-erythritol 2,4-cyclodiphosphate synthase [Candidatus Methylospira mobilis]QFY44035.1 2-C-methyl-D-erythritol 2,4-cyclodiphosphate synthase [Candidatus Methylospira mobilis]WNV05039.1 2-C-methyl-D-erythritol 2,4-cyclodiphosphate synthase [Candidatus Methylospira mobilis]
MFRIGQGYDAHKFKEGDHIVLGGVGIPFTLGMAAHSDGDVALHALCDALLGAVALGDIGKHFPDTDNRYKGIDSRILLREVAKKIAEQGYIVANVDLTIIAQAPRMAAHIPQMRVFIADDLGIAVDRVNVKATTTEGMGFEGRGEGISAMAVTLLQRSDRH